MFLYDQLGLKSMTKESRGRRRPYEKRLELINGNHTEVRRVHEETAAERREKKKLSMKKNIHIY